VRPYLSDPDLTLYHGHALTVLRELPAESVHCCVTSPPYWGLRSYGTAPRIWDSDLFCMDPRHDEPCDEQCPACQDECQPPHEHEWGEIGAAHHPGQVQDGKAVTESNAKGQTAGSGQFCRHCPAWLGDFGLEPTPELYVQHMVEVFREVRRVLRKDGTCWLNLGDSYNGTPKGNLNGQDKSGLTSTKTQEQSPGKLKPLLPSLKPKDLVGIPWRVAFALQADGWYLRSDIVWSKPNPMPESVIDRPTKAHEYVFLLSKGPRYFFDQEAVREAAEWARWGDQTNDKHEGSESAAGWIGSKSKKQLQGGRHARRYSAEEFKTTEERNTRFQGPNPVDGGRNIRSVWEIATQPYPEAHFATYPEELVRRCILAGCPEGGTVIDPFGGSGTTALVARKHGRRSILIELNESYCAMTAQRLSQLSLLAEPA
jgi:DNA modification methylase